MSACHRYHPSGRGRDRLVLVGCASLFFASGKSLDAQCLLAENRSDEEETVTSSQPWESNAVPLMGLSEVWIIRWLSRVPK
ncbi:hypothetical protein CPB85DRAFT_1297563 [Mucidula mucida]|nr:hypothetical protein CPB85DRAFT_1297563 [Mucidula mucida]